MTQTEIVLFLYLLPFITGILYWYLFIKYMALYVRRNREEQESSNPLLLLGIVCGLVGVIYTNTFIFGFFSDQYIPLFDELCIILDFLSPFVLAIYLDLMAVKYYREMETKNRRNSKKRYIFYLVLSILSLIIVFIDVLFIAHKMQILLPHRLKL